ncbi:RNA polymerase-binding protein RbpA [Amycolatopsis alba]|uniref:RNA polymerase-binding protein RbpA n=1 Tax=Amycolatopsis alba DSM 44262 TaxID=1125972 RepID=A0A229RCJ6_AMYAL|nr:RNA polymerase-binding protein RbpA [Amycolatopsis alba]OXM44134.1 RNA polymerase-binding protein RbpA [Amycolatopsis alba DSM 44262]
MPRTVLRGYRWGGASVESDQGVEPAARLTARFACSRGHVFTVPFAADAEPPPHWSCRQHGLEDCARIPELADDSTGDLGIKPRRTHLDMLHERRSAADLETLLAEALTAIRRQGGPRPGCVHVGDRTYSFSYDS